jgi:hypothetical protein
LANTIRGVKKRLLHGVGTALMLASPFWLTLEEPPNYFAFGISLSLGILVNVLGLSYAPKPGSGR